MSGGRPPTTVVLAHADDWTGFRRAARRLLRADMRPEDVRWRVADENQGELGLFAAAESSSERLPDLTEDAPSDLYLPRRLLDALRLVILHRAADRLERMYRLLWRWRREPAVRGDPLDADLRAINDYHRAVRRDAHRMLGFVRFRSLVAAAGETAPQDAWRIAWHEPRHRVLRLTAPFFVRRFPNHRWAILTPDASVAWDTARLLFGAGARVADAPPPDAGEALWLVYYANHFNAGRRNPSALRRCLPPDYWKNLPEAGLIAPLLAERSPP